MLSKLWLKLIAASLALIFCVAVFEAWRADRIDRAQLAAELASTKQLLQAADTRQRDRDAQLAQTLSALANQERSIVTPAQIVQQLAKSIPLPAPITLQAPRTSSAGATLVSPGANASAAAGASIAPTSGSSTTSATTSSQSNHKPPASALIPAADLKPLYDFTLDCQACQAKLSAAQSDLTDEKTKTAALTKERDDALRVAKGGSAWRRVTRAAKWFLLGAAAGAVASKAR